MGLCFAIPSVTILIEFASLFTDGSYAYHPSLGITAIDMTYENAKAMNTTGSCGCLVITSSSVTGMHGGTKQVVIFGSAVTIGGDAITTLNGVRITSMDDLSIYLEEHALPGHAINVTVLRNNQVQVLSVTLGT